jgi:sugar fermentation stimulation protein A
LPFPFGLAMVIHRNQPRTMPVETSKLTKKEKGAYILVMKLKKKQRITVGKLPVTTFHPGFYLYVGKAKKGLKARLNRHLSKDKRLFWHIDYFLQKAEMEDIWIKPDFFQECQVAGQIKNLLNDSQWPLKRFGSSDCVCPSHLLFIAPNKVDLVSLREKLACKSINIDGVQV